MAGFAIASSSTSVSNRVFLSFRSDDTRNLRNALISKQIETYIDEEPLANGILRGRLLESIEKSEVSVIIFSKNYASSSWCFEELIKILRCKEKNNHMVGPVFYGLDPSGLCKQQRDRLKYLIVGKMPGFDSFNSGAIADFRSPFPALEGDEQLIAAATLIASAIRSNKNCTDELKRLLDLHSQLSSFILFSQITDEKIGVLGNLLDATQKKVMSWEADQFAISCAGREDSQYLNVADEARMLAEKFNTLSLNKGENDYDLKMELRRRASDVLQMAMAMLEKQFTHLVSMTKVAFHPQQILAYPSSEDSLDFWNNLDVISVSQEYLGSVSEDIFHFDHVDVIPKLRTIATLMFKLKFEQQCIQSYTSARKDAFEDYLFLLKMENLSSIEEVRGMDWTSLSFKIKRWIRAVQIFVRVFLAGELCLSDKIFGELGQETLFCTVEASKTSMLLLLDFGKAFCAGLQQPERLLCALDTYVELLAILPNIEALCMGETGSSITMKFLELLRMFGDCVKTAFTEFENVILSDNSTIPVLGGGIHPLSKYVMKYIRALTDYSKTLNTLFKDDEEERDHHIAPFYRLISPIRCCFVRFSMILEHNLDAKSKLYDQASLQHLFMMNNIHYMTRKVKSSKLRPIFGENWIREHYWKCHLRALDYERASWGSVFACLKDEVIENPHATSSSTILLKLQSFFSAFEEIYNTQTGWVVPDDMLREDLQISISLKVLLAYRTFVGKYNVLLSDKRIKYGADDMENYLLDLFKGCPKSL